MSAYEGLPPLDRDLTERLLGGDPAARAAHPRLARLLDGLTAGAGGGELRGEAVAMAAFVAAQRHPTPRPRRTQMMKTALAKLLTVKVAAACVAFAGVGGVALAASTDSLPGPLNIGAAHPHPSVSASPRPHPSGEPKPHPSGPPPSVGPRTPDPRLQHLLELCKAYADKTTGKTTEQRGQAVRDPKFRDLIPHAHEGVGAKDADRIGDFCARILKEQDRRGKHPHGDRSPEPTPSGNPGPRTSPFPTGSPAPRPAGR